MALCHITGTLFIPDGSEAANRRIQFQKLATDVVTDDYAGAVVPEAITTKTDANGDVDVYLVTGYYVGTVLDRRGNRSYTFKATVPDQATANLSDLINSPIPVEPIPAWLQEAWAARDAAEAAEASAIAAAEDAQDSADAAAALLADGDLAQGALTIGTRNSVETLNISSDVNTIQTNGYHSFGDGGAALYSRVSIEPNHIGKVQSLDGAWWVLSNNEVYLKQLGAVDGADATNEIQGACEIGLNIIVDGRYLITNQITHDGPLSIRGLDDTSELHWPSDSVNGGISLTPQSWYDYIEIKGVRLTTAAVALWNAISIDWYDLGTSGIPYFWVRARILSNRIMGSLSIGEANDVSRGWLNGVYLNYPFSVEVMDNYIFGAWDGSYNANGINAFQSNAGIYVPDQSQRTLAYLRMERNSIFYAKYGVSQFNIEGTWLVDNDIQVTWVGVRYENTISPVNQHRIYGNHIGVYDTHIQAINCRQVLIENNEISYRRGRTDGGSVSMVVLDGVLSGSIVGNSIRGNIFNLVDVSVSGVLLINNGRSVGDTRDISINSNQFQNLNRATVIRASAVYNVIGPTNTYNNMMGGTTNDTTGNSAISPGRMGSGSYEIPAGQNPALYLTNKAASSLLINREVSDGAVAAFARDNVLVGSITVNGTSTNYGTSSDSNLKHDRGELSYSDAMSVIDLISIHDFEWKSNGKPDVGVFAQELYDIYPSAVLKGGWVCKIEEGHDCQGCSPDCTYQSWSVDYSKLIPIIIRAIQGIALSSPNNPNQRFGD